MPKYEKGFSIAQQDITAVEKDKLIPCNPKQSQSFGRRLFRLRLEREIYWLKAHVNAINHISQQAFLNEVNVYKKLAQSSASFILPFQILNHQFFDGMQEDWLKSQLLIRNSRPLFEIQPLQLTFDQVVVMLIKSLDVLQQMHDLGWLHGDLKAEHFRVYRKKCYLIDLEQASRLDQLNIQNSATPRYMAPELFHGQSKTIQTDLYALGIVWLEWLTQQRLQEKSYMDWAVLHCQRLKVDLPIQFLALKDVLEAMLCKHKQQRCTNIYQIKQILSKVV